MPLWLIITLSVVAFIAVIWGLAKAGALGVVGAIFEGLGDVVDVFTPGD